MHKRMLVLFLSTLPYSAVAQTTIADVSCKAPISIDDKACADLFAATAGSDRQKSLEQRDDGYYVYYVFVPHADD